MSNPSLRLYTDSSPNGFKISIALEELSVPYQVHHVRIADGEHQQAAFLKLHPHARIPVLVDTSAGITLFESAAILLYLAERSGRLLPQAPAPRWEAISWLMFHSASVGPILGQRVHFEMFADTPLPAAIERYRRLSNEFFATLDQRLADRPWLAGEEYSIADIAGFGWTHIANVIDMDFSHYPHLSEWHARIARRPAVQRGVLIPEPATGP
ncbi:glutathione S-transferase family protein [Stenotrophomonas terrae]|uniref:glutathione S-transferase family protein n=1 Tax=Stenotrophomonas terrae TaxID=405446 RepID=UPI0032099C16